MACVYCNVLTSKITAEATCDRLSCYPTKNVSSMSLPGWLCSRTDPFGKRSTSLYATGTFMAQYLPKQCRVSRPQFPQSTHGTPGTMTPLLARKTVAFYDSGFPTEAPSGNRRTRQFHIRCDLSIYISDI